MYAIAIDPGFDTGLALVTEGDIVWALTSKPPHDEIKSAIASYPTVPVVCEQGPSVHRHREDVCMEVEDLVRANIPHVVWVTPSQWKKHPATRLSSEETAQLSSQHEKDAVCIGRWFLATRRQRDQQPADDQSTGGDAALT